MTIYWNLIFKGKSPCGELERLYVEQGLSILQIADFLGVSSASVHGKLIECGIETRERGGSGPRYAKEDLPDLNEVTADELAARTGYSLNYCRKLIWRHRREKKSE